MNDNSKKFEAVTIATNNDFEMGAGERGRTCTYAIHNANSNRGLVVYIPGFGGDLGSYTEVFCRKIAEQHGLATMAVEYFGISSRPNVGAGIDFNISEQAALRAAIEQRGGSPVREVQGNLDILAGICSEEKSTVRLFATLSPKNDEYQNFGILPALDVLNSIRDAVRRFELDENDIILVGSSYGGYIANLATKIAPGFIRAVFDNSSWAQANLSYVVGRELRQPELVAQAAEGLELNLCVKSPWTLTPGMPNSFENSRREIRAFSRDQLIQMADQGARGSTFHYFYHAIDDLIAPTGEKVEMCQAMIELGYNVQMEVAGAEDVDGKFLKNCSHGMGMSMVRYFRKCMEYINEKGITFASAPQGKVRYDFEDCSYEFDLAQSPIRTNIVYG